MVSDTMKACLTRLRLRLKDKGLTPTIRHQLPPYEGQTLLIDGRFLD
jgi:phosphotransferase system IIB component